MFDVLKVLMSMLGTGDDDVLYPNAAAPLLAYKYTGAWWYFNVAAATLYGAG
jgi:hypothetical protein